MGVDIREDGDRGSIWLRRPAARNALDGAGWLAIAGALEQFANNPTIRVVILGAEGDVFCAGGDMPWMRQASREDLAAVGRALAAIEACPKPVVARVQGSAFGGGVGLLAACDLVIASTSARFALSEVRVGVAPAIVARAVVRRIGGARFRAWALTGEPVDAPDALSVGLVDRLSDPSRLDDDLEVLLAALRRGEPAAQAAVKGLFPDGLADGAAVEVLANLRARPAFAVGIAAVREKRPPTWARPPP